MIEALALVEARIDFSDEADVPEDLIGPALHAAQQLRSEIAAILADGRRGERLREGLVVAIAGPPNAGKSTLLNRLARRDAAIVSPYAGTTRDIIEVHLDLDGFPVTLLDTAGIRESNEPVEQEGMRRARERAVGADVVLWVVDAAVAVDNDNTHGLGEGVSEVWLVENKLDLIEQRSLVEDRPQTSEYKFIYSLSAASGAGVDPLIAGLSAYASAFFASVESGHGDPHTTSTGAGGHSCCARSGIGRGREDQRTRRAYCRGAASCGDSAWAADWAGRCRRYLGCHLSRFLHRQVRARSGPYVARLLIRRVEICCCSSLFHVKHGPQPRRSML